MKQKLLNKLWLRVGMIVAIMTTALSGTAWAEENDTHDFAQTVQQLLNNNASISSINIDAQSYSVKKVVVSYRYNKTLTDAVTVEVTVNGTSWGTQNVKGTGNNYSTLEFTGDAETGAIEISFTNNTGDGTGHGTFYVNNVQLVEGASAAPLTPYTVTFSDGGSVTETTGGAGVTLPSRNAIGSYTFAGWSETNVTTETTTAPTIIPAGIYNPTSNITLYPVYTRTEGGGTVNNTASVNIATYASDHSWVSGSNNGPQYTEVVLNSDVKATTTGTNNNGKYYNSDNSWRFYTTGSGNVIISTTAGTLSTVTLTFSGGFTYGEDAITSGTAVSVSGTSAEFTCTSNAKITAISVTYSVSGSTTYYWSSPVAAAVETPNIVVAENPFYFSTTATITCATAGATIYYTLNGNDPTTSSSVYSTAIPLTATTTIKALAVVGSDESTVASVTATKNLATPTVTVSGDLTDDLAGETNVNAGTLTAAVTYNNAAVAGATVTWESSDTDVATIDASTGAVTLLTTGEVTFTATYAGNGDYASATGTKTITVVDNDPNAITIWSEDFSSYNADDVPSGGTYSYSCTDGGSTTKVYAYVSEQNPGNLAGGSAPELLVSKGGGSFTAVVPLNQASGTLTLKYKTNAKALSVSTTTDGISGGDTFSTKEEHTVTFTGVTTSMTSITIVFATSSNSSDNVRLDDIVLRGSAQAVTVEAPTFSVNGGTYYTAQSVELSCATDGATIYYTTNGDEPTSSSTEYTGAITVSETMTIKAIAIKGSDESTVSSATYNIAEKNDVVFSITDKSIAYGETYTVTKGSNTGRDIQTDGVVTVSTSNADVVSISGMTIKAEAVGTTTITLTAAEGDTYKAGSKTITITVTAPTGQITAPAVAALFNETFDKCDGTGGHDGEYSGNVGTSVTTGKLDEEWTTIANNGAHQCIKLGTGSAVGTVKTRDITLTGNGILTFSAAGWGTGTNTVSVSAEGATLSGDIEVTLEASTWNTYTVNISEATGTVAITFAMKRGFLDDVKVIEEGATAPAITYTIPSSGFGTFCSEYPLDLSNLPEGVKAYTVTEHTSSSVKLTQITTAVKGGVGLIIEGTPGAIEFSSVNSSAEPENELVGTLAPVYLAANTAYGLKSGQFHPNSEGTIGKNRAYLPAENGYAVKVLTIEFDDATGITRTRTITDEETIYDLMGRRLNKMQKGINIVNGKKILK